MIYDNIAGLCKDRGISIAKLEDELKLGNATIRKWKTSSPSVAKLKLVADYFGVSIESLIERKTEMTTTQE